MPISKKDRVCRRLTSISKLSSRTQIQREHKRDDKAGTRAPVKANGLPVKAPKPTSLVRGTLREALSPALAPRCGNQRIANSWVNYSARTAAASSSTPTKRNSKPMRRATTRRHGRRRNAGRASFEGAVCAGVNGLNLGTAAAETK
jgi:hypothetical protein